jgi:uncharacterized protein YecE (DUF72 family)
LPDNIVQNNEVVYYRFHGVPNLYRSPYPTEFLQMVVDTVNHNENVKEAWCYFNNDYDAVAIANAKEMLGMVGSSDKRLINDLSN